MTGANGRRVVVFSDPRPSRYPMCLGGSMERAQQLWIRTCLDSLELGLREIHDPSSSWGALSNGTAAVMTDDELRRAGYAPEMRE